MIPRISLGVQSHGEDEQGKTRKNLDQLMIIISAWDRVKKNTLKASDNDSYGTAVLTDWVLNFDAVPKIGVSWLHFLPEMNRKRKSQKLINLNKKVLQGVVLHDCIR